MDLIPKKKLGFGLMRLPTLDKANAASVDLEQVSASPGTASAAANARACVLSICILLTA